MKLTLLLPLCLLINAQQLGRAPSSIIPHRKITWDNLAAEIPGARTVLLYCDTINRNPADCAETFLGHGIDISHAGTSYVSRAAAQTCLDRSAAGTARIAALDQLFDVDIDALASRAAGSGHSGSSDDFRPNSYSDAAKDEAGRKGWNEEVAKINAINKMQDDAKSKDPFFGGRNPDNRHSDGETGFLIGRAIYDAFNMIGAYQNARDDPGSVGQQRDLECHGNSCRNGAGEHTDASGRVTPEAPEPETPEAEPEPGSESETPDFEPTPVEDFEPILETTDLTDEQITTPMLLDETFKTGLERCQEEEEQSMWRTIGTQTIDPDSMFEEQVTEEQAQRLLNQGFCDIKFYGAEFCKTWKNQRDRNPVSVEWQDEFNTQKKYSPLCPVNLVDPSACDEMKEEVRKRYAWPEVMDGMFDPGRPVSWLPGRKMDPLDRRSVESEWFKSRNGQKTILGSQAVQAGVHPFIVLDRPVRGSVGQNWQDVLGRMVVKDAWKPRSTRPGHDEM